jgi:hypothetical protein
MPRYKLRTLLIVLALAPPLIALYVAAMLAARDVARAGDQVRRERAILELERASFEKERAALRATPLPAGDGEKPN